MIHSAAWRYWQLNDPCCNERRTHHCSKDCQCYLMTRTTSVNCPFTLGICTPSNTWLMVPWDHPSHHPKRHLDLFSRFCTGSKCYAVQCIVNGEEKPQNCLFPLGFRHPPEEDRATAIGNMHKRFGMWIQRYARGQTDTHTDVLITILHHLSHGRSEKYHLKK